MCFYSLCIVTRCSSQQQSRQSTKSQDTSPGSMPKHRTTLNKDNHILLAKIIWSIAIDICFSDFIQKLCYFYFSKVRNVGCLHAFISWPAIIVYKTSILLILSPAMECSLSTNDTGRERDRIHKSHIFFINRAVIQKKAL